MATTEKKLEAIARSAIAHLVAMGPCDDDDEDGFCSDAECTYCGISRAMDALSIKDKRRIEQGG